MALSINAMIRAMHEQRDEIERITVGKATRKLEAIFGSAERRLAAQQRQFLRLERDINGNLVPSSTNIRNAGAIMKNVRDQIDRLIVKEGQQWADELLPVLHEAGATLAKINLDVDFIPDSLLDQVFAHLSRAEGAILRVGKDDMYTIMGTVGDDVAEWFRSTMLDSIAEGIPVVGPGDTLTRRLIEGNRIAPITIKTERGRLIRRSLRQRANAIARVESAKVINRTHDELGKQALGDDRVGMNSNPRDSRTTDICSRASRQEPKTEKQWRDSEFGLPPRLKPFHLCRSVMIWGKPEWFADDVVVEDKDPQPPPKTKPKAKRSPARRGRGAARNMPTIQQKLAAYTAGDQKLERMAELNAANGFTLRLRRLQREMIDVRAREPALRGQRTSLKTLGTDPGKLQEVERELSALSQQRQRITNDIEDLKSEARVAFMAEFGDTERRGAFKIGKEGEGMKSMDSPGMPDSVRARPRAIRMNNSQAGRWFDVMWKKRAGDRQMRWDINILPMGKNRAHCILPLDTKRRAIVEVDGDERIEVYIHEIGHMVERDGRGVLALSKDFRNHRIGNEAPTKLQDVLPNYNYRDNEFGRRDDFEKTFKGANDHDQNFGDHSIKNKAYYTGKEYADGMSELPSMGFQLMYENPFLFAENDPEFAKFILGLLDGELRP